MRLYPGRAADWHSTRLLVTAELSPKANPMDAFQCVSLAQHARAGAIAHGICFAIHVVLAVFALSTKHPWSGALWMLLPAVIPHFYSVLLQRSILLRLQPLQDNAAARRPIAD